MLTAKAGRIIDSNPAIGRRRRIVDRGPAMSKLSGPNGRCPGSADEGGQVPGAMGRHLALKSTLRGNEWMSLPVYASRWLVLRNAAHVVSCSVLNQHSKFLSGP